MGKRQRDRQEAARVASQPSPSTLTSGHASHPSGPSSLTLSRNPDGSLAASIDSSQTVTIPFTIEGLRLLSNLLHAQELALANSRSRSIGTNAKPIQEMVEKFLKTKELEKAIAEEQAMKELAELF